MANHVPRQDDHEYYLTGSLTLFPLDALMNANPFKQIHYKQVTGLRSKTNHAMNNGEIAKCAKMTHTRAKTGLCITLSR